MRPATKDMMFSIAARLGDEECEKQLKIEQKHSFQTAGW
jgi:hypothetical protein